MQMTPTQRPRNELGIRTSGAVAYLLLPHVPRILHRVHQRQFRPALVAVTDMHIEELGFLVGEVVL